MNAGELAVVRLHCGVEHAAELHLRAHALGRPLLHPCDRMRSTPDNGLEIAVCDGDDELGLQRLDRVIDAIVFGAVELVYHARRPGESDAEFRSRARLPEPDGG